MIVHFFQIIYVDSLAIPNVQILATMPRIATWTKNLLDEVIKLDTNGDGSFGKLKVLVKTKPDYFLNISQTTIFLIITQTITNPFFPAQIIGTFSGAILSFPDGWHL